MLVLPLTKVVRFLILNLASARIIALKEQVLQKDTEIVQLVSFVGLERRHHVLLVIFALKKVTGIHFHVSLVRSITWLAKLNVSLAL